MYYVQKIVNNEAFREHLTSCWLHTVGSITIFKTKKDAIVFAEKQAMKEVASVKILGFNHLETENIYAIIISAHGDTENDISAYIVNKIISGDPEIN